MADIQNETEDKAQDVNSKVDVKDQVVVSKAGTAQKGEAEAEFKSTIADLPWTSDQTDLLGMEVYRNAVIDYISRSDTPFSIALVGEWGCGKTSIMNAIYDSLCKYNHPPYYGIWINTWQFSLMTQPQQAIISMLQSMVDQIAGLKPCKETDERRSNINKLLVCLLIAGLKLTYKVVDVKATGGMLSQIGLDANTVIDTAVDEIRKIDDDKSDDVTNDKDAQETTDSIVKKLKTEISCLIHDVLIFNNKCTVCNDCNCEYKASSEMMPYNGEKKGFVFFIDDLDRIPPVLSIDVIEVFKNIFDIEKCIFVVAVDHHRLERGLESKFGPRNIQNDYEYVRYLDKIFQIMIPIRIDFYDTELLIEKMIKIAGFDDEDKLSKDELKELDFILRQSVGGNPRSIKNFFNKLSLACTLSKHVDQYVLDHFGSKQERSKLNELSVKNRKKLRFIFIALGMSYPEIYGLIELRPYFRGWDSEFVYQILVNNLVNLNDADKIISLTNNELREPWELALFQICFLAPRLRCNFVKILNILRKIDEIFKTARGPQDNYEDIISELFGICNTDGGVSKSMIAFMKSCAL
ncbi:MAG TPA: KAP family NTPase [Candidatus Anaerobiospirillum stercoravium]|nr:KAP family NTPase [Candidatus Anaerobiospirillum stercoravium]